MDNIVRTAQAAKLQTSQFLNIPHVLDANTTLNEKFNIQTNVSLSDTDKIGLKYIGIGNAGHTSTIGVNGISKTKLRRHKPRHAALFNQLPFILRLPTDDLTALERPKYRLRRLETHNGVAYVAYYLRLLDLSETQTRLEFRTADNGVVTSTPYVPTLEDLNPVPEDLTPGSVLETTGDYVSAVAKVSLVMNAEDMIELRNVCNVIYGDEDYSMITEAALCSGVDRSVTGDFNGASVGYTEAIGVQVMNFAQTSFFAKFNNIGIKLTYNVGAAEPLFELV